MTEPKTTETRSPHRRPSYTHAVFSDFSGDDGTKFGRGSTSCLTLAWLATREDDVEHNERVLFQIKKAVGCRPTDELKYVSVKSHPRNKDATLRILGSLKVDVSCVTVFKKPFLEQDNDPRFADPRTKMLVVVMQSFPFSGLIKDLREHYGDVRPRIVVDEVHWRQTQDDIIALLSEEEEWFSRESFQFRPSGAVPLLQIADIFCGAVREFCEGIETQTLPPCHVCRTRNFKPRDCGWRRKGRRPDGFNVMSAIYPLLLRAPGATYRIPHGLYFLPDSMNNKLEFIDCLLGGK